MLPRVVDGRVQQLAGNPLSTGRARDDEADDRPDRLVVDRRKGLRVLEALVIVAWPDADPADRLAVAVGDEPGLRPSAAVVATAPSRTARLRSADPLEKSTPRSR